MFRKNLAAFCFALIGPNVETATVGWIAAQTFKPMQMRTNCVHIVDLMHDKTIN